MFGIANCDTVRRARAWLDAHGIAYTFRDFKKEGADPALLSRWADEVGWQRLINTRGTTFRKLPEAERAPLDRARALALMAAHPSLVKRPVVAHDGGVMVGFDPESWAQALPGQSPR